METKAVNSKLKEVGARIKEMREISGYSVSDMASLTDTTTSEYRKYEAGLADFPFTFIHKCALAFNLEITDILEGHSAKLSAYTVTRKGQGQTTADEEGINICNLAPMFKKKLAEPYYCLLYTSEFAAAATPRRSSGMRTLISGKSEAKVRPTFPEGR